MKDNILKIRLATPADAGALLKIYDYYVKSTAITLEWETHSLEEFQQRMRSIIGEFPYLVAELNGEIVGYTYAAPFSVRAGYGRTVETTVYVKNTVRGCGAGGNLYYALMQILKLQNILNLNARIAYSEVEDEYLTHHSPDFHAHLGYRLVGRFTKCVRKFDRWYDIIWMEKIIGEHSEYPAEPLTFDKVRAQVKDELGIE